MVLPGAPVPPVSPILLIRAAARRRALWMVARARARPISWSHHLPWNYLSTYP